MYAPSAPLSVRAVCFRPRPWAWWWSTSLAVVLAIMVLLSGAPTATAQDGAAAKPSPADVEWVQRVLRELGYDGGRPNGVFTARTRQALIAFQRDRGLPATGTLDPPTTQRLIEDRPVAPTMGVLGETAPSQAFDRDAPAGAPPRPQAAPRATVEAGQRSTVTTLGVVGTAPAGAGGRPSAAPRGSVEASVLPGSVPRSTGAAGTEPLLVAGPWVRWVLYGVLGLVGVTVLAMWLGTNNRSKPVRSRRAPSLTGPGTGTGRGVGVTVGRRPRAQS